MSNIIKTIKIFIFKTFCKNMFTRDQTFIINQKHFNRSREYMVLSWADWRGMFGYMNSGNTHELSKLLDSIQTYHVVYNKDSFLKQSETLYKTIHKKRKEEENGNI